jgi:DNA-directed RNA polymerase subunit RPC12/RpoP
LPCATGRKELRMKGRQVELADRELWNEAFEAYRASSYEGGAVSVQEPDISSVVDDQYLYLENVNGLLAIYDHTKQEIVDLPEDPVAWRVGESFFCADCGYPELPAFPLTYEEMEEGLEEADKIRCKKCGKKIL